MAYQAQPEIPGYLDQFGSTATGVLTTEADKHGRGKASVIRPCHRCGGQGGSQKWEHTGYTCYQCGGSGYGTTKTVVIYTPEAYKKLAALREIRAEKKRKEAAERQRAISEENNRMRASRREAFIATYPGIADRLSLHADEREPSLYEYDDTSSSPTFLAEMYSVLVERGELSENQVNAVIKVFSARDAYEEKIKNSYFLADVGSKLELSLTNTFTLDVTNHSKFPVIYRNIVIMETADGQQVKYIGNANSIPYKKGETRVVVFTVKEHCEYKGIKQTVIQRPRAAKDKSKIEAA